MRESVQTSVKKPPEQKYSATSWEMQPYLGQRLVFSDIIQTNLRLDIILWSHAYHDYNRKRDVRRPARQRKQNTCTKIWLTISEAKDKAHAINIPSKYWLNGLLAQSSRKAMTALEIKGKDRRDYSWEAIMLLMVEQSSA